LKRLTPRSAIAALFSLALIAGCGHSPGSPTGPSSSSSTGATISGSVRSGAAMLAVTNGGAITGITVTIVNTSITSGVDAAGRFNLTNVPAGALQLRFSGPGVDATLPLDPVVGTQTIELVVDLTGTAVTIESEHRSGSGDVEVEGRVESLPPTTSAGAFKVSGVTVVTGLSTRFEEGSASRSFADLALGMRVHVKGTPSGSDINAMLVQIQNTNTWIPVQINGVIDSVSGNSSAFQFKIGSRVIKGDSLTDFFGDGDAPDSFASLNDGDRVEVKGQQKDDYVYAARIHINGSTGTDDGDGQDSSASIQGKLTSMSGGVPTLTLTVGGTKVTTTSGTEVKRRGDVQTLDSLRLNMTLHVVGDRQADGSIIARKIEITDDQTGGEFEIAGSLGGLQGTCPAISFSVNGYRVTTNASTTFDGGACSTLKSGTKVGVKGLVQSDGSVVATKVTKQ
jgi:uncharacterized protein DUF5666